MPEVDSTQGENYFHQKTKTLGEINREDVEFDKNGSKSPSDDYPNSPLRPHVNENRCEAHEGSESENQEDVNGKKRRRRRVKGGKHHRKWKPYSKMNWLERHELEERETERANQKRETAFAHGHPVAPYNTTQYLMEDHIKNDSISPDLHLEGEGYIHRHYSREGGLSRVSESSEETTSSCDEDEDFMEKEFSETYNSIHAERLNMMSKDELIKDYLEMETKLERLEKRYENKQRRTSSRERTGDSSASLSS